jgi:hypothetical protein
VLLARAGGARTVSGIADRYRGVRFIAAADGADVPRLRATGLAAAAGDLVALLEDHCVADRGWLDALIAAAKAGADVAGGAMDNGRPERIVDWAAYFSEYGFFAERSNTGPVPALTGANVAYRRPVIEDVRRLTAAGEWENVVHAHLHAQNRTFAFVPTATVRQNQSYGFAAFCRDRFEHGRDYARRRLAEAPPRLRWMMLAAAWALPPLLAFRIARVIARRQRPAFLRALPVTLAFLAAWAGGEWWGYLVVPARRRSHP